jgi:hypothetical protein
MVMTRQSPVNLHLPSSRLYQFIIVSNQWLIFCLPFILLLFNVILPVLVLILLKKPCRRLRTRCVAKYVFRGPPRGALALNMRTEVMDCVTGATIAAGLVVVDVHVLGRLHGEARVARKGEDVDVRMVEKSLLVVGVADVRRRETERGLCDELISQIVREEVKRAERAGYQDHSQLWKAVHDPSLLAETRSNLPAARYCSRGLGAYWPC